MAEIIFGIDHGNGNMKGENVTDFRTNPAVFLGGGSLLLRKQIENSPEFKYVEFIDDIRANAIGYEKLTTARLRRG